MKEMIMNKTAFVISAILTAFVLAIAGGVVLTVRGVNNASAAQAASPQVAPTDPASTLAPQAQGMDPQTAQEIQQREVNYQKLIAQANQRLLQAQQTEQQLQAQLAALQTSTTNAAQTPAPVQVTPEQAAQIAAQYLNQPSVYSVETTLLQGQTVYLVTMSSGDIVYVSLAGQILGTQPVPAVQPSTRILTHNGGGESEHEGGGDD
jgi:hypothetical protein